MSDVPHTEDLAGGGATHSSPPHQDGPTDTGGLGTPLPPADNGTVAPEALDLLFEWVVKGVAQMRSLAELVAGQERRITQLEAGLGVGDIAQEIGEGTSTATDPEPSLTEPDKLYGGSD